MTTSKYANIGGVRPQRPSNFVRAGHFLARIDRFEEGTSFQGGDYLAVQMTILKVFEGGPIGMNFDTKAPLAPHSIGESVAEIMKKTNVAYAQRAKAFLMAADGLTEADFAKVAPDGSGIIKTSREEYPGQMFEQAVGPNQPLAGVIVEVRADQQLNRGAQEKQRAGLPLTSKDAYTRVSYIRALSDEEAAALIDAETFERFCRS